jgi:hypothetical protein
MEKKIIITKRFRNNTLRVYQYLIKEFSAKTAYKFIDRLEKRIEFIARTLKLVKHLSKEKIFAAFCLHHITKFFIVTIIISLKFFVSLTCERTQRKNLINIENESMYFF